MNPRMHAALAMVTAAFLASVPSPSRRRPDRTWAFSRGLRQGIHYGVKRRKRKKGRR